MKKIMLLFVALFMTISAAHANTNVREALNDEDISVAQLLQTLIEEDGMTLQQAVDAILEADGDRQSTLVAALIRDPGFSMPPPDNDPVDDPVGDQPAPGAGPGGDAGDDDGNDDLDDLALNDDGDDRTGVSP